MKIYHNWQGIKHKHRDIVAGLGNFDGVHIGHQRLISGLVEEAGRTGGTPAVFTFHPHPLEVLAGKAPPRLITQRAKEETFRQMGVKVLLLVPFTLEFASLTPDQFIEKVLVGELGVKAVFVGYNYTFGRGGRGTAETLAEGGRRYGFRVHVIPPVTVDGVPVSSTLIRSLLADGEVSEAKKLLGYYPFVEGEVVAGEKRGRTLGFPTANINLEEGVMAPANGVYAVKVQVDGDDFLGVANIGVKPTFRGYNCRPDLEVHLLDFKGDLYGKRIKVFITRRIREEMRFSSPAELADQIRADINTARTALTD
ncbi:MAG: bifunctional riboflavin kinase/FAD synthetase [Peptococcaceae bacterium]|nr:bifunctional riboflavin kinase/FAD synthetase [Peptococcaceae bacterium]